jgi:hypothetical protein
VAPHPRSYRENIQNINWLSMLTQLDYEAVRLPFQWWIYVNKSACYRTGSSDILGLVLPTLTVHISINSLGAAPWSAPGGTIPVDYPSSVGCRRD